MIVPKKRISITKKHIHKNCWKKKGFYKMKKAFSLGKSIYIENFNKF
nr:ribosomal protein L32 [Christisonia kwangtungensis]